MNDLHTCICMDVKCPSNNLIQFHMLLDNCRTSITCSHVSAKSLSKSENKSIWLQLHVWLRLEFHALHSFHSVFSLNLDTGLKGTCNFTFSLPQPQQAYAYFQHVTQTSHFPKVYKKQVPDNIIYLTIRMLTFKIGNNVICISLFGLDFKG